MKMGHGGNGKKIGSVLATFEGNIAKNQEMQAVEGGVASKSFLTTIAVNPSNTTLQQKIKLKSSLKSPSDLRFSQHGTKDGDTTGIDTSKRNSKTTKEMNDIETLDSTCVTDSTYDEESTLTSPQHHSSASSEVPQQQYNKTYKDRVVRKVAIIRSTNTTTPTTVDTTTTTTTKSSNTITSQSGIVHQLPLDSPTKATIKDFIRAQTESHRRNILQSSNSDRAIVDSSNTTTQQQQQQQSIQRTPETRKSTVGSNDCAIRTPTLNTSITKMGHAERSPLDKIAATIRRVNSSNSLRELASEVAKQTKSSTSTSKASANPGSSKASLSSKSGRSGSGSTLKSRIKLSDHMMNQQSPSVNGSKKRHEKSIVSLPITIVASRTATPTRQPSFYSLPEASPSKGAKGIYNLDVAIQATDPEQTTTKTTAIIEVSKFVNEVLNSQEPELQEVDLEYGPQNIVTREIQASYEPTNASIDKSRIDPSLDGDGASNCETAATPVGIAKAARRSSVDLTCSTPFVTNNMLPGIAKAARRPSVELVNATTYEDINSVSGITTISDDSILTDIPDIVSEAVSNEDPAKEPIMPKSISNLSLLTLDLNGHPVAVKSQNSINQEDDVSAAQSSIMNDAIYLPPRCEVLGILRSKCATRNVTRHVKFADQQPGGGQRMSLDRSVKNDSLPVQPRRSNRNLDRLEVLRQKHNKQEAITKPIFFMSILAATTIQAAVRRWIQWTKVRPQLLLRKLVWIEKRRNIDIAKIQQEKWEKMERLQEDIIESEKRLDAQVSLGEKLCEHLKRDSKFVRDQTKKLKEYCRTLQHNNDHLEQSSRLLRDNFMTMNFAVDFLQEKSDTLLTSSRKCASRIDKLHNKLQLTESRIELEKRLKVKTMKTLKRIIRLLEHRGVDIFPLINEKPTEPINLEDIGPDGFELAVTNEEDDDMSMYSDITTESARARAAVWDKHYNNDESFSNHLADKSQKSLHTDELNRTTSSAISCGKSCENSFASYRPRSSRHLKSTNDVNSVNGNSFASYGTYGVSGKVADTSIIGDHNDIPIAMPNTYNAKPPSRRASARSGFDAIHEEVSILEESAASLAF